uniref:ATP-grasp domain-containing protein n=1 Tax=candidate division WWE3 bacterium TaxID=2053526 RepID=A0A7C4TJI1_UNCKA
MKIKQIYIGNILESYYKSHEKLPKEEGKFWIKYDALDNNRSLLYGKDNKVIITPTKINETHLISICKMVGWKNALNIYPKKISKAISLDLKNNKAFRNKLIEIIKENPNVEIIPYRQTSEFYELVSYLKKLNLKFLTPETMLEETKFIESYFHSKRGFRHLWEMVKNPSLPISIPQGYIVENLEEAIDAGWWFSKQKKDFVIKYNRGVQGIGVAFFLYRELPKSKDGFTKFIKNHLTENIWNTTCLVVEEKIEIDKSKLGGSPNVELCIDTKGNVHCEYGCEQVLAPDGKTFEGIRMNKKVDGSKHIKAAFLAGRLFGKKLAELGYKGIFEFDLVISKDNKLFAVESNLRRNGGTHIHEFCKTLLGKGYTKKYWIHSQDINLWKGKKRNVKNLYKVLEKYFYKNGNDTGVIITNPDMITCDVLSILFIAKTEKELEKLIKTVREKVLPNL